MIPAYLIEVRESDGDLVQVLKNAFDMELEESINAPKRLTFSLPATDPKLHYITKADELWVRDIDADTIIAKTKLIRQEDTK